MTRLASIPQLIRLMTSRQALNLLAVALIFGWPLLAVATSRIPVAYEDADRRAGEVLAKLSIEEKLQLISGHNKIYLKGFPKHGMPELFFSDATQGINIRKDLGNTLERSTAFPCALALAATWNRDLAYRYANSVGEEARAAGIAVVLGPGFNIYRISQNGRNFEYFGEDPYLAARLVERYVIGMLDTGTMPTLKHFVANNSDYYRRTSNSVMDDRTLHEIYLPAFQAGIDAGATAVMTAYNQLNSEWTGQSHKVITDLLRNEMGFKWLVMTDWRSVWDAEKVIKSGQDLEMPGNGCIKADGPRLLASGVVAVEEIDRMAKSIIRTCIAMGFYDRPIKDEHLLAKFPEHVEVALQTARESLVLLKNEGILPIRKDAGKRILVTGKFVETLASGGGAAKVEGYDIVTMQQALKDVYGDRIESVQRATDEQIKSADVVLLSVGTLDSEGWDRAFDLPKEEEQEIIRITALNPHTVVVVNSGGGIKMTDWHQQAAAIIYGWYPGQIGNRALAGVICGEVNPSGKLPITIEKRFEDSPGYGYIPAGEKLYTGWKDEMAHPINSIHYNEGVFVGYRWYEAKKIEPLYAFGHGLSYTTFAYSDIKISPNAMAPGDHVVVGFTITNTGKMAGGEVAQLYVSDKHSSVSRPEKELKGFEKVTLQPGEKRAVSFTLSARDFSYWDTERRTWKAEAGEYGIQVGTASNRIELKTKVRLQ